LESKPNDVFEQRKKRPRNIGPAVGECSVGSWNQKMLNKNTVPGLPAQWSADNNKPSLETSTPDDHTTEFGQLQSKMA